MPKQRKRKEVTQRNQVRKATQVKPEESKTVRHLREQQMDLNRKLSDARRAASDLKVEFDKASHAASELERKLKGRDRLVADMHNNHVDMRRSLIEIRELHMPGHSWTDAVTGELFQMCKTCDMQRWPCPTYRKIKTPEHLVVTSLLDMERDLSKEHRDD